MEWLKRNKKLIVIVVVGFVAVTFLQNFLGINITGLRLPSSSTRSYSNTLEVGMAPSGGDSFGGIANPSVGYSDSSLIYPPQPVAEKVSTSTDRKVITDSNMSLLVNDVKAVGQKVLDFVQSEGGFMVQTSYNRPTESPFGTIIVRVPSEKLNTTLDYFRSLSIKVTSENLVGNDVTDQYENIEEKLLILEKTKQKFEAILSSATTVQETLTVQREVLNIQAQIDSLIGRKDALEKNAAFSKVTIYLSTDELALPYTPDTTFRPAVIFKLAVRSLLNTLRVGGEWVIWVGVYAVIWVPLLIAIVIVRRFWKRQTSV